MRKRRMVFGRAAGRAPAVGRAMVDVFNPAMKKLIGTLPPNSLRTLNHAVRREIRVSEWSPDHLRGRAEHMRACAMPARRRSEAIATTIACDVGTPMR